MALHHFREAAAMAPGVKRYEDAVASMLQGAHAYRKKQQADAAEAEAQRLKELQEEEDAAWEEEGLDRS
eukprot:928468-Prymnesium_polylepis.1